MKPGDLVLTDFFDEKVLGFVVAPSIGEHFELLLFQPNTSVFRCPEDVEIVSESR